MNNKNKEIKLINLSIIAITIFIITLLISLLLNYNEKLKLENKKLIFDEKQGIYISLINRTIVLIIALYFIYNSYIRQKIDNKDDFNSNLELLAAFLAFISSFIAFYIVFINLNNNKFDVSEVEEEKMIESIIYTLTSIKGIDKIIIKVEGNILTNLPHSKKIIPSVLDRSYGINKEYELTTINNIDSYTVYYVNKYNDSNYYVPVTKYINKEEIEPVKVIIKELSSSPIYETNLMSHLNAGVVLNDYELDGNNLKLNFNELLLSDPDSNKILEEVIYTIGLSMNNIYNNLETVSFYVNNNEVYALTLSDLK